MDLVKNIASRLRQFGTPRHLCEFTETSLSRKELGDYGEALAVSYLKASGYKFLYQNFKAPKGGEVDIVCRKKKLLAFVEVKTRMKSTMRGRPLDAVNQSKQALIERGGNAYLKLLKRQNIPIRYDVIEIILIPNQLPEIKHVQNAF